MIEFRDALVSPSTEKRVRELIALLRWHRIQAVLEGRMPYPL